MTFSPFQQPGVIQGFFPGGGAGAGVLQRRAGTVQLHAASHAAQIPSGLAQLRPPGAGQRLPETVLQRMEALFGTDFSDVRIHVGNEAPALGALAFTHGSSIYFAPGQYAPMTPHGERLISHELTHVVQQRAGRVRNPFGSGIALVQDPGMEAEAERMSLKAGNLPIQAKLAPFPELLGVLQARKGAGNIIRRYRVSGGVKTHIFDGEINGNDLSGFHSMARKSPEQGTVQIRNTVRSAGAVYAAEVRVNIGGTFYPRHGHYKASTMFPDGWDEDKVVQAIEFAFTTTATPSQAVYEGTTPRALPGGATVRGRAFGVKIEGLKQGGVLATAYPVL